MSFYDSAHDISREYIKIDSFSTTNNKFDIIVNKESNEFHHIPHFHVHVVGELAFDDSFDNAITIIGHRKDMTHIVFHNNMDKEIALCIDKNMFISHFTTRYYLVHPILLSDSEFIDALNKCLRKEINQNGQTNWDYICMAYHNYLCNDSSAYPENQYAKECPIYTKDMILIQQ